MLPSDVVRFQGWQLKGRVTCHVVAIEVGMIGNQFLFKTDEFQLIPGWWQLKYFWNVHPENWER